jgi:hypothetical protein
MTVFRKLLVAAGGLIALILAVGVFLPSSATVERTAQIDAHAATVFALVNDLQQVRKWSPWIDADPNIKIEMSASPASAGRPSPKASRTSALAVNWSSVTTQRQPIPLR